MSNVNMLFIPIYLIGFIYFSHRYISILHDIRIGVSLLQTKKFEEDILHKKIKIRRNEIKTNKKYSFVFFFTMFALNLFFVGMSEFSTTSDYQWAIGDFGLAFVFQMIIYWMKGSGTIDSNARLPGGYRL